MDQEYSQSNNGISPEDIQKFNQEYAAKLSLADDRSQVQAPSKAPPAPPIYNTGQYTILDNKFAAKIYECNSIQFTVHDWNSIVSALFSQDILQKHYGIIGIRKILSIEDNPPIHQVIDAQLVPVLIEYAQQNQYSQLKFEALWALTNVASGTTEQTQVVVDKGGIQLFVGCLDSPVLPIVQQAIWAIGNLAGDNVMFRDMLIFKGTLDKLVNLIAKNFHHVSLAKNGMWALCNLCRGNPRPQYTLINNGVRFCCQYLIERDTIEKQVLTQLLWVLAYPDELKDNLDLQTANKLIAKVITYVPSPLPSIIVPILRLLSNLFENEAFADCFIKNKWIDLLVPLLSNPKLSIQRETCFLIGRLTDIHNYEICEIFVNPLIVQTLLKMFETADCSVKFQIAYLFANLSCHDNLKKVYEFYRLSDIVKYYVSLLTGNQKYILATLQCLDRILEVGQKFTENGQNMFVARLEELNAVITLENLQCHSNVEIYQTVFEILDKYFSVEQDENSVDQANNNNQPFGVFGTFGAFGAGPAGPGFPPNSNPFKF